MRERGWEFNDLDDTPERYLFRKMLMFNLPWTIFLCAVGVLPHILISSFAVPFYIGGASLYVAIAIGLDILDRFNAQRRTRTGRLVKIAEFHDVYDASMIRKHLRLLGITSHFQGYYHRQLLYFFGPYIDISLMVALEDVRSGEEALKRYYDGLGL